MTIRPPSYVKVVGERAGFHHRLVQRRVVLPPKQDVVAHCGMLDPGLLGSQGETGLPALCVDRPTQPGGRGVTLSEIWATMSTQCEGHW